MCGYHDCLCGGTIYGTDAPDFAYENVCKGLLNKLKKNCYHLNTGFVGTISLQSIIRKWNERSGLSSLAGKRIPGMAV